MEKPLFAFVFFATGWGPTEGGINAVNFDLCNAMGEGALKHRSEIYCVVMGTTPLGSEITEANGHGVTLIHVNDRDFEACRFDTVLRGLLQKEYKEIYWIGHDIVSGKQALACKSRYGGSSVLFHHMHYMDYYAVAKSPDACNKKDKDQREAFAAADYAIAVGPQLYDSLIKNVVVGAEKTPKCGQIIPGLASINPLQKVVTNPMTVLFTGRLEEDNDPIKQYSVPLYAVSDLVKEHGYLTSEIVIKLIGLRGEAAGEQADRFKELAKKRAERVVNVQALQYTASRGALFDDVRRSIVTVMPSISEGFGLAGYESIAAAVPTIISKNSGLYRFLRDIGLSSLVFGIDMTGDGEKDAEAVKGAIFSVISYLDAGKEKAFRLREELLKRGYTWEKTAEDTYAFLLGGIGELALSLEETVSRTAREFFGRKAAYGYPLAEAVRCADRFAESVEGDRQAVLSRSVDNLYSVRDSFTPPIDGNSILGLVRSYLEAIARELKSKGASEAELAAFTDHTCRALGDGGRHAEGSAEDHAMAPEHRPAGRTFAREVREIVTSVKFGMIVSAEDREVLKRYHGELLKKPEYNTIDFRGVAAVISEDPEQSKVNLGDIYVPIELKDVGVQGRPRSRSGTMQAESFERLIVIGDPGSGKSTYLKSKMLAHCAPDSERMCIFIAVSEFFRWLSGATAAADENPLEKYIEAQTEKLSAGGAYGRIYAKLKSIGAVDYYIDGLDEVQDSKKKDTVTGAIIGFIAAQEGGGHCRFFITSRKIGLDARPFADRGFTVKEIAPLSESSIEAYIDKWYSFVGGPNEDAHEERRNNLKAAIMQDKALSTLAGNPLLLSIIAILHYHGRNLPKNKAALYKTITETLLQTWIEHRNFTVLNGLRNLDNQDLTNIFSRAAYWIIENRYDDMSIGRSRLGTIYDDYCRERKRGIPTPSQGMLLEYISKDAGIVIDSGEEDGERLYRFLMHRQFAEYYAAMELDHKLSMREELLPKVLDEPKWTEVSILMCDHLHTSGEGGDVKVQNYISALFTVKPKPVEDFRTNVGLILKWIGNGVSLSEEIMGTLFGRLDEIFRYPNRFRAIGFAADVVNAFAGNENTWYREEFCKFAERLIDSGEEAAIGNVGVMLDLLLRQKDVYEDILNEIGNERITSVLRAIIEKDDFHMLVRTDGCYRRLFLEKFAACVNRFFGSDENERMWIDYTTAYAFEKRRKKRDNSETFLTTEAERFQHERIRREFVDSFAFWGLMRKLMETGESEFIGVDIDYEKWGCKSMLTTAEALRDRLQNRTELGRTCANISRSHLRLFYNGTEESHIFTAVFFNREKRMVEMRPIVLPLHFGMDDLRRKIEEAGIGQLCSPIGYLNILTQGAMPQEDMQTLFDIAFADGKLLLGNAWHQFAVDKIAEDGEVFYRNFEAIKRAIKPFEDLELSKLKDEYRIYFDGVAHRWSKSVFIFEFSDTGEPARLVEREFSLRTEDKERVRERYENTEDAMHKAVLYEILYNMRNIE